jgi:hypothetical protein
VSAITEAATAQTMPPATFAMVVAQTTVLAMCAMVTAPMTLQATFAAAVVRTMLFFLKEEKAQVLFIQ